MQKSLRRQSYGASATKLKELLFRIAVVILVGAASLSIFWWGGQLAGQ
ncbi:MAG: hypothetical protein AAB694_02020 [Patescibacteria group bacterium]